MVPPPNLTSDKLVEEKQISQSSTSPTNTEATSAGDTIEQVTKKASTEPASSLSYSLDVESAQPQDENKKQKFLLRVTKRFRPTPEPAHVVEVRTRKLEETPVGFPRLAAFQSSEANFALYRSFGYLHSRLLLDFQDELTMLEKELDDIDWEDYHENPNRLKSREIDVRKAKGEENVRNRRTILKDIRERLMEYDEVLIKARELESFQRPSNRNYRSVRRYHYNTKPIMDAEMDAIRSKEDIVSLHNGREWAAFDGAVETTINKVDRLLQKVFGSETRPLQRIFITPELASKTSNEYINFYSSSRIENLVNILITFVIFILLVIPIVTLYHMTSKPENANNSNSSPSSSSSLSSRAVPASGIKANNHGTFNAVGVLIVFTLVFSAAMSLLTKAARHELFAASAAYCAILVVFIGNFTGPGN